MYFRMKKSKKHQQGIALYVIIVLVLLSMLLALWASRTALFNELIVGNNADYQRAYEAAEAMLEDAKNDISQQNILGAASKEGWMEKRFSLQKVELLLMNTLKALWVHKPQNACMPFAKK